MNDDGTEVQKAIKGSDDAFLKLMEQYKTDLYKTALAYLHDQHEALEAVQEVTFRAYRKIHTVRKTAYFKTWLIRIMINYCNDQIRKKKRFVFDDEAIHRQGVTDNLETIELEDAMLNLDDRSREILTLKYFHDLKIKDIAAVMKCPEGTVKTWLNKALQTLRNKLDDKEEDHHV